jgi:hypothetical protein
VTVLVFELRASHLLGRHATAWTTPPACMYMLANIFWESGANHSFTRTPLVLSIHSVFINCFWREGKNTAWHLLWARLCHPFMSFAFGALRASGVKALWSPFCQWGYWGLREVKWQTRVESLGIWDKTLHVTESQTSYISSLLLLSHKSRTLLWWCHTIASESAHVSQGQLIASASTNLPLCHGT